MEIGLTKRPEGELAEYKSARDSKVLRRRISEQEVKQLRRQVSQKMDAAKKSLLPTLDDSISIVSSMSSGRAGPSASASDDDFESEEDEKSEEEEGGGEDEDEYEERKGPRTRGSKK